MRRDGQKCKRRWLICKPGAGLYTWGVLKFHRSYGPAAKCCSVLLCGLCARSWKTNYHPGVIFKSKIHGRATVNVWIKWPKCRNKEIIFDLHLSWIRAGQEMVSCCSVNLISSALFTDKNHPARHGKIEYDQTG